MVPVSVPGSGRRAHPSWHTARKLNRLSRKKTLVMIVAAVVTILVLIALLPGRHTAVCGPQHLDPNALHCHPRDSRPPYPKKRATPPPQEIVQRRPAHEAPRAALFVLATAVNQDTCAHWSSAILSGFKVSTLGFGRTTYGHLDKMVLVKEAIDIKKMRDWDVVFYADQDTIYTGQDIQPFVEEFIRLSPEHPDDINVRSIRRGEKVAPMRFTAEPWCTATYSLGNREMCASHFDDMDAAVERVAKRDEFTYLPGVNCTHGRGITRFLNAGVFMARVWAVKELLAATPRFTELFPFPEAQQKCDQSIYAAMYVDQRMEEAELGLLAPRGHLAGISRTNQFGLHYGLIDIWQHNRVATLAMNFPPALYQVSGRQYGVELAYDAYSKIGSTENQTVRAAELFRDVHDPGFHVSERRLSYTHPGGFQSVPVAPPLLAFSPRPMDETENGDMKTGAPALLHFADGYKLIRIVDNFPLTGWHIAMELVPGQKERSLQLLRSSTAEVITANGDVKQHPVLEGCASFITDYVEHGRNLLPS